MSSSFKWEVRLGSQVIGRKSSRVAAMNAAHREAQSVRFRRSAMELAVVHTTTGRRWLRRRGQWVRADLADPRKSKAGAAA